MDDRHIAMLRDQLVERLSLTGRVQAGPVAEAFGSVPRHVFLPRVDLAVAYADEAVVTQSAADR